jgi:hypothetical protein
MTLKSIGIFLMTYIDFKSYLTTTLAPKFSFLTFLSDHFRIRAEQIQFKDYQLGCFSFPILHEATLRALDSWQTRLPVL